MPTPVPAPAAADSTGLPETTWISDLRNKLRDQPQPALNTWLSDGVGGLFGFGSGPLKLNPGPVYDGTPITTWIQVRDTTSSTNYTPISSGTPSASQVLVNYDTMTVTWLAAPTAAHNIAVGYYTVKWTDAAILAALMAGLRQMFPSLGKTYVDSATQIQVNQWDYTLPAWAQSPDAQISRVEVQDPAISTEPWRPLDTVSDWSRVGNTLLHLNRAGAISPVGKLRITGWGPYLALGDLEPDLYNLPLWYAAYVLTAFQESYRIRQDTAVALNQEGGQQPGLLTQTADFYRKQFENELRQKKRAYGPPGSSRPMTTTYSLNRHY